MLSRNMKANQSCVLKIFVLLNLIFYSSSWSFDINGDVEGSGMETYLIPFHNELKHEQQSLKHLELKLALERLEENIGVLLYTNMKIETSLDELKDEMKLNDKNKISYKVNENKCSDNKLPKSCYEVNECNNNVYSIMIPNFKNEKPLSVVCDFKTLNGGWTIIQRRQDNSENFNRNWTDYVNGFGDLNGEFFIGLEKLHVLTTQGEPQELYIKLEDFEGTRKHAQYKTFQVDSESTKYKLTVNDYNGNAGDSFGDHNGHMFSTPDSDNDEDVINCAERFTSGWWFNECYVCNLNGKYNFGKFSSPKLGGIEWMNFRGYDYSLKFVQMMIRPKK